MKLLTLVFIATSVLAADKPTAEDSRDALLARYFRLVAQWQVANAQLVQVQQAMKSLERDATEVRASLAKECKSTEELKDVPADPNDSIKGTVPACVAKPEPPAPKPQ